MDKLKTIIATVLFLACTAGSVICLLVVYKCPQPSSQVNLLVGILLYLLSTTSSVIAGFYFARISASEKVDTIAERSTEKMVNLSAQLEGLATYLEETPDVADDESDTEGSLSAYRHRCQGAALLTRSLTSSNEVFSSDWLGVASSKVAKRIEGRFAQFKQKKEHEDEQRILEQQLLNMGNHDEVEISKVKEEIEELKKPNKNRPLPEIPKVARSQPKSIEVYQEVDEASDRIQNGKIILRLRKSSRSSSGMGKLDPRMSKVPVANLEFLGGPPELDSAQFAFSSKPGTKFDFPINIKYLANNLLPVGDYRFKYEVKVQNEPETEGESKTAEPSA